MSEGIFLSELAREFKFFYPWLEYQVKQADILAKKDQHEDYWLSEGQMNRLIEHLKKLGYELDAELDNSKN